MITRRKDYNKQEPSKDASKIYIVCEGKGTEHDYFTFFEGLSSNLELIIIPPEDGTDPVKLKQLAERDLLGDNCKYLLDFKQNDKIWFAIDTDTWEEEGKIQILRDFCTEQNAGICLKYDEVKPYSAWNVAQSNPCFEIWLYYHHYSIRPDTDKLSEHTSFKAYVDGMIAGGFNFQKDQARLKDALEKCRTQFSKTGERKS